MIQSAIISVLVDEDNGVLISEDGSFQVPFGPDRVLETIEEAEDYILGGRR